MEIKLTLRLNDKVIQRAKNYARNHNISLSKIIEAYLNRITQQNTEKKSSTITPIVKSLSGVINLPEDIDHKKEYRNFLKEKHK